MKPLAFSHGIGVKHDCDDVVCPIDVSLAQWQQDNPGSKYWFAAVVRLNGAKLPATRYVDVVATEETEAARAVLSCVRLCGHFPELEALHDGIHTVSIALSPADETRPPCLIDFEVALIGRGALDTFDSAVLN